MSTKLLSIREACDTLKIGCTKLYSLINNESLITVRLGSRRLVVEESVSALIEKLIADGQK